jgi:hypothetical protein
MLGLTPFPCGSEPARDSDVSVSSMALTHRHREQARSHKNGSAFEPAPLDHAEHIRDILHQDPRDIGEGVEVAGR